MILGYYEKLDPADVESYNSLKKFGSTIQAVSMASYNLTSEGTIGITNAEPLDGLSLATSTKKFTYALFVNKDFDGGVAHRIIGSTIVRTKAINSIVNYVISMG